MNTAQDNLNKAVLYALKVGCFFPVPEPAPPYTTMKLKQWGAMHNLHNAIAAFYEPRRKGSDEDQS